MHLRVEHITTYDYTPAVETAQHMVHLKPLDHARQRLLRHQLTVTPTPAHLTETPRRVWQHARLLCAADRA